MLSGTTSEREEDADQGSQVEEIAFCEVYIQDQATVTLCYLYRTTSLLHAMRWKCTR